MSPSISSVSIFVEQHFPKFYFLSKICPKMTNSCLQKKTETVLVLTLDDWKLYWWNRNKNHWKSCSQSGPELNKLWKSWINNKICCAEIKLQLQENIFCSFEIVPRKENVLTVTVGGVGELMWEPLLNIQNQRGELWESIELIVLEIYVIICTFIILILFIILDYNSKLYKML